jgi:hypothetical protein
MDPGAGGSGVGRKLPGGGIAEAFDDGLVMSEDVCLGFESYCFARTVGADDQGEGGEYADNLRPLVIKRANAVRNGQCLWCQRNGIPSYPVMRSLSKLDIFANHAV